MPYGEFGAISPDGKTLAYVPISVDFRTWKRYRGGMNPDIWLFDLEKLTARNLTRSTPPPTPVPMWHGDDALLPVRPRREQARQPLGLRPEDRAAFRQVTFFKEFDVHFPGIGPADIVFENAGRLYLLDLQTEKSHEVEIRVVTDRATLKPRYENVSDLIQRRDHLAHRQAGAVRGARRHLLRAGRARRGPATSRAPRAWPSATRRGRPTASGSPTSATAPGEYELTVRSADGSGTNQRDSRHQARAGLPLPPQWSPDSKQDRLH